MINSLFLSQGNTTQLYTGKKDMRSCGEVKEGNKEEILKIKIKKSALHNYSQKPSGYLW